MMFNFVQDVLPYSSISKTFGCWLFLPTRSNLAVGRVTFRKNHAFGSPYFTSVRPVLSKTYLSDCHLQMLLSANESCLMPVPPFNQDNSCGSLRAYKEIALYVSPTKSAQFAKNSSWYITINFKSRFNNRFYRLFERI